MNFSYGLCQASRDDVTLSHYSHNFSYPQPYGEIFIWAIAKGYRVMLSELQLSLFISNSWCHCARENKTKNSYKIWHLLLFSLSTSVSSQMSLDFFLSWLVLLLRHALFFFKRSSLFCCSNSSLMISSSSCLLFEYPVISLKTKLLTGSASSPLIKLWNDFFWNILERFKDPL